MGRRSPGDQKQEGRKMPGIRVNAATAVNQEQCARAQPEQRLLIAILEDAIQCFEKHSPTDIRYASRLFREAEEWIMSEQYHGPFSFEHICSILGLEPGAVRHSLRREHRRESGAPGRYGRMRRTEL
jgi:hypothetical protein